MREGERNREAEERPREGGSKRGLLSPLPSDGRITRSDPILFEILLSEVNYQLYFF